MIFSQRRSLLAISALLAAGCGGTVVSARPGDAATTTDATPLTDIPSRDLPDPIFDGGSPVDVIPSVDRPPVVDVISPPVDSRVPRCGDSVLDPGESCDDGNNASGDGCSATCRFEARCGDGRVDMGELCDDGNNRSGDGCRSDCQSNETCGNRIVDTARGEICDSSPGCGPDCRSVAMCGNNRVDPGEQCDDGNTARWDGCGPDCRVEQAMALDRLSIAADNPMIGCDFSGDRNADNAFARALGPAVGLLNSFISNPISNGQLLLQLTFLNLTDPRGQNLADTRVGWVLGSDGDDNRTNNLSPGNPQRVQRGSIDAMTTLPLASFQSRVAMGNLSGGPEDIFLPLSGGGGGGLGMFDFRLQRARVSGLIVADATRIVGLRNGVLCGVVPARDLARIENPAGRILGGIGGGGGGMSRSSFLELIVGGQRVLIVSIGPQQPDVDLDGDGLERFEGVMGVGGTEPRIESCVDGDGTVIPGRDCVNDPRMADGFSAAFQVTGQWVTLRGIAAGGGGGMTTPVDAGAAVDASSP